VGLWGGHSSKKALIWEEGFTVNFLGLREDTHQVKSIFV